MRDLKEIFLNHQGRLIDKWSNYLEIYDQHFSRFRGKEVVLIEFGVFQGGSLQMWREYFGDGLILVGVDINPECKKFADEKTKIIIGDQGDVEFLKSIKRSLPRIDILIDDASHLVAHQILTFKELFPCISENGIYLCEDNHTSYWPEYGGGYRSRGTYIEYIKGLVDSLHGWHAREGRRPEITDFTRTAQSIHFYDSIVVIEKRPMTEPRRIRVGDKTLEDSTFRNPRQFLWGKFLQYTSWLRKKF